MPHIIVLACAATFIGYVLYSRYKKLNSWKAPARNESSYPSTPPEAKINKDDTSVFEAKNIIPLPDFDWLTTEPLKIRPFKPKFHLTMGLTNITPSAFLTFDSTYLSRLTLRTKIISSHPAIAIQASTTATPAVNELYNWLISTYLPTRFPTLFTLTPTSLLNNAFDPPHHLPLTPPSDPLETLKILGENIDQDFLFMLRDEKGEYRLRAYVVCFPSGFNTKKKFGLSLKDIHAPVPGYKEKLEMSMDRFFEKVEVGKVVGRAIWSINTTSELFTPHGTHLYEGQEPTKEENFDINEVNVRTEYQTLHRLPNTRALVFTIKTRLYPLSDIKAEGLGEDLAQAIEGLKTGSVPEMDFYKKGVVWGARVKEFLRS